ncbi:MAG: hypothetical protein AAB225_03445 [Acidobacteriota bacterium]
MDTRTKIVTPAQAEEAARVCRASGTPVKVVSGHFDPLLAGHARRLGEIARPGGVLIVIVTDPPRPLLAAEARAELAAALAVVDYVVLGGPRVVEPAAGIGADEIFNEEAADEGRRQELIRHVHERQQTG